MKIGIIGIGAIGGTIAKKLAAAGHQVKVNNTGQFRELSIKAKELGAVPATITEVIEVVDIVILSIPTAAVTQLPVNLFKNISDDVVIVDTTNYYPFRDGVIEELQNGKVESIWVSEQLGRPVIKAFNNLLAHTLQHGAKTAGEQGRIAMAISGDDKTAKEKLASLVHDLGFDAVDAGTLSESWKHQPGTPAYCTELSAPSLKQALAYAVKENSAQSRDFAIQKFMDSTSPLSHTDTVALNRSLFSDLNLFSTSQK
jgi:predicted dinucleotide-binding enzyme